MLLVDNTGATECSKPRVMLYIFQEDAWRSNVTRKQEDGQLEAKGLRKEYSCKGSIPRSKKLLSEGPVGGVFKEAHKSTLDRRN